MISGARERKRQREIERMDTRGRLRFSLSELNWMHIVLDVRENEEKERGS